VQILFTDVANAGVSFNLLDEVEEKEEPSISIRYFDFSSVFDNKTKKTYKLDSLSDYDLDLEDHQRSAHFFTQKFKP
jgi:hypothetical protein